MPPLSILLKPASSGCNLRCTYCFYADEASMRAVPNYGLMSSEVSHTLIEQAAGAADGSVTFLFQGGEPTLAGLDFYRDFVSHVRNTAHSRLAVQYAIQTNGMLLDEAWCRFFRENRFLVGLSLDGNRACHDRFRRDAGASGGSAAGTGRGGIQRSHRCNRLSGQAYSERFWRAVQRGLPVSAIYPLSGPAGGDAGRAGLLPLPPTV